jgi:superfamily II DNA or RNA helicase
LSDNLQPTGDDFIKNFPFPTLRERQSYVLNEIAAAFTSGYKYIVLEAPTGFGKSPDACLNRKGRRGRKVSNTPKTGI